MTKEGTKAVRFCCGFNTDLRVKLTGMPVREKIYDFLRLNRYSLFGPYILDLERAGCLNAFISIETDYIKSGNIYPSISTANHLLRNAGKEV